MKGAIAGAIAGLAVAVVAVFAIHQATRAPGDVAAAAGGVTLEERNAAVRETIACIEAQGVKVRQQVSHTGELEFSYGGVDTREELDSLRPVYGGCFEEHLASIEHAWRLVAPPAVAGTPEEKRERTIRCLMEHGEIPIEEELSSGRVAELLGALPTYDQEVAGRCARAAFEGLTGP
jgi:hypothetical protein